MAQPVKADFRFCNFIIWSGQSDQLTDIPQYLDKKNMLPTFCFAPSLEVSQKFMRWGGSN